MQHEDSPTGAKAPAKAWSGRFAEPVDRLTQRYTASVAFDQRLAEFDIQGSLAPARMLSRCGILPKTDLEAIERGLALVAAEIREGRFEWSVAREDVHLNIEYRLTELVNGVPADTLIAMSYPTRQPERGFKIKDRKTVIVISAPSMATAEADAPNQETKPAPAAKPAATTQVTATNQAAKPVAATQAAPRTTAGSSVPQPKSFPISTVPPKKVQ